MFFKSFIKPLTLNKQLMRSARYILPSFLKAEWYYTYTAQKMKFSTEEILNGKFHFLCSVITDISCKGFNKLHISGLRQGLAAFPQHRNQGVRQGRFKKTKHAKFSAKKRFLPLDTHTYVCVSGGKKCLLFGKFGEFCFLKHPF